MPYQTPEYTAEEAGLEPATRKHVVSTYLPLDHLPPQIKDGYLSSTAGAKFCSVKSRAMRTALTSKFSLCFMNEIYPQYERRGQYSCGETNYIFTCQRVSPSCGRDKQ
jgi:hypothetical protein